MLEGIICPACEATLDEIDLKESLTCKSCKTDLKDRRFLEDLASGKMRAKSAYRF